MKLSRKTAIFGAFCASVVLLMSVPAYAYI